MKRLKAGDRIRLKVRTIGGWRGFGIVGEDQAGDGPDALVWFRKEDEPEERGDIARNAALRYQVAVCRVKANG